MHLLNEIFIYFFNLLNIEKFLISFALEIGLNYFNFQKRYNNKLNKKLLFQVKKIKNFMIKKVPINKLNFLQKIYQEINEYSNLKKFQNLEYGSFKKEVNLINYVFKLNQIGLTYSDKFVC